MTNSLWISWIIPIILLFSLASNVNLILCIGHLSDRIQNDKTRPRMLTFCIIALFNYVPQFEFYPVTERCFGVFKTHIPPSTISHMSSLPYRFLKQWVKEKSLKGALYKNQWTSKLRLITTILFCTSVLLLAFDHLIGQFFRQDMTFIYILIWINSKITFDSIEDIKRETKNIKTYWIFLCCYILWCYCSQCNKTEQN